MQPNLLPSQPYLPSRTCTISISTHRETNICVQGFAHIKNEHKLFFRSMLDTHIELLSSDLVVKVPFLCIRPYQFCFSWRIYYDRDSHKSQGQEGLPGCLWKSSPQKFVFKGCPSSDIPKSQLIFLKFSRKLCCCVASAHFCYLFLFDLFRKNKSGDTRKPK